MHLTLSETRQKGTTDPAERLQRETQKHILEYRLRIMSTRYRYSREARTPNISQNLQEIEKLELCLNRSQSVKNEALIFHIPSVRRYLFFGN